MPQTHFIERLSALLIALVALLCWLSGYPRFAMGVLVGGLLSAANFYVLRVLLTGIVQSARTPRQALLSGLLFFKFLAVGFVIYLLVTHVPLDVMGMLTGVTLVVLSIFVEGFRLALRGAATQEQE